jgi:hypothetical protein
MEVLEEEELRVMRNQQQHFADLAKTEHGDANRMEQMEQRKLQEYERRKALERERKKNKFSAHRKICSRFIAKGYLNALKNSAVSYLSDVGYFVDTFKVEVLEQNVMPWMYDKVESFVDEIDDFNNFSDHFLGSNVKECLGEHLSTVNRERLRKENVKRAIFDAQQEKLEEKRRKKEAKELARKAAELKKLRDDVNKLFVLKGEYKDSILSHEPFNANGYHMRQMTIGVLGGFLGQMIIVVSGAHRRLKMAGGDAPKMMLEPKFVQNFLFNYID